MEIRTSNDSRSCTPWENHETKSKSVRRAIHGAASQLYGKTQGWLARSRFVWAGLALSAYTVLAHTFGIHNVKNTQRVTLRNWQVTTNYKHTIKQ